MLVREKRSDREITWGASIWKTEVNKHSKNLLRQYPEHWVQGQVNKYPTFWIFPLEKDYGSPKKKKHLLIDSIEFWEDASLGMCLIALRRQPREFCRKKRSEHFVLLSIIFAKTITRTKNKIVIYYGNSFNFNGKRVSLNILVAQLRPLHPINGKHPLFVISHSQVRSALIVKTISIIYGSVVSFLNEYAGMKMLSAK